MTLDDAHRSTRGKERGRLVPGLSHELLSRGKMGRLVLPSRLSQDSSVCTGTVVRFSPRHQIRSISSMEEEGLENGPDRAVVPMFTQNICGVGDSGDVVEPEDAGGNGFSATMKREGIVALVQLGMGKGRGIDDGLVVPEHHVLSAEGHTKIPKGGA